MEFNEKLVDLRKNNGWTQEQLAQRLNISRTAVSKWESGRGFPNIEALKNISKLFDVPVDHLLSGEELLSAVESDTKTRYDKFLSLVFGIFDLLAVTFIFLPLYGRKSGDYILSVNLFQLTTAPFIKISYFAFLSTLGLLGAIEILLNFLEVRRIYRVWRIFSLALHSGATFMFIITREPYINFFLFTFLLSKIILFLRRT